MTNAMMMERSSMMTGMGPMAPGAMGATATMPMPPQWMMVPRCTMTMDVENPLSVLDSIAGPEASTETRDAVSRAESRQQALAIIFMSPEFQRR